MPSKRNIKSTVKKCLDIANACCRWTSYVLSLIASLLIAHSLLVDSRIRYLFFDFFVEDVAYYFIFGAIVSGVLSLGYSEVKRRQKQIGIMDEPFEPDFHLFSPNLKAEEDKATVSQLRLQRISTIHQAEMFEKSTESSVPREILNEVILSSGAGKAQMEMMEHATEQTLRLEEGKAKIEVDKKFRETQAVVSAGREDAQLDHRVLQDLEDRLFAKFDQRKRVEQSDDPSKAEKLALIDKTIKILQAEYDGRIQQSSVSQNNWDGLGAVSSNEDPQRPTKDGDSTDKQ